MRAMVIRRYGAAKEVLQAADVPTPAIKDDEALVRLRATSVNAIEYKMRNGYGRRLLSRLRGYEFPVVLGNDVCGVIEKTGAKVARLRPGDEVFTALGPAGRGSYCEFAAVKAERCIDKPGNLTHLEAASIPYTALTTWAALVARAKLGPDNSEGKTVLVHGGSGGIGSFAIQLLKSWGAHVATTCSTAKIERVRALGPDLTIDYQTQDFSRLVRDCDVVLDTVGGDNETPSLRVLKERADAHYVTLLTPLAASIDDRGFLRGGIGAMRELMRKKRACGKLGIKYDWGTFRFDAQALTAVKELIENGKIKPVVDRTFPLGEIAEAHEYAESGKAFGKIGIDISSA